MSPADSDAVGMEANSLMQPLAEHEESISSSAAESAAKMPINRCSSSLHGGGAGGGGGGVHQMSWHEIVVKSIPSPDGNG